MSKSKVSKSKASKKSVKKLEEEDGGEVVDQAKEAGNVEVEVKEEEPIENKTPSLKGSAKEDNQIKDLSF